MTNQNDKVEAVGNDIAKRKARRDQLHVKMHESLVQANPTKQSCPDYAADTFPWSQQLCELAKKHWHIAQFRSLQLPVLNAALQRENDLFIVLPTGAGKSLCYQLPVLLEDGFTLVVSPLVALINDQIHHLGEAKVPAVSLTAASTLEDVTWVHSNMIPKHGTENVFKLLYVTPEKIARNKKFMTKINQAYLAGKLSRIVIDEAHCCSQQGHDFRPDYKLLSILRTVFPETPIMALTATCTQSVMKDVLDILGLKPSQKKGGVLVFSAPLYRPNLIYKVLPKGENDHNTIHQITQWILTHHPHSSGIIYCQTKKDTDIVSNAIFLQSQGRIQCGVYHADLDDADKKSTHQLWRQGKLQVIVATIAFGMGVDHPQTRFILHHTMSKSLEGYYQESGRAGRDGQDADCVLYYRGQDASRLSSMMIGEVRGRQNLYSMINYAQEYKICRKELFEKHFSHDASVSPTVLDKVDTLANGTTSNRPCGKCDNCTRDPASISEENITLEAMTIVKLCRFLKEKNERVTMHKLIQFARGRGLKSAYLQTFRHDRDIDFPIVKFSNQDLERMINHLLLHQYLAEDVCFTQYQPIVYITEGQLARNLYSLTKQQVKTGKSTTKILFACFRPDTAASDSKSRPRKRKIIQPLSDDSDND